MDLVAIAEAVAKSPYGLPLFLLVVVWYTTTLINKKDMYMETHIKEDLEKAEEREQWYRTILGSYQNYMQITIKHMTNIDNNIRDIESSIHDIESILHEGRVHFESDNRDDETPSNTTDGGRSLNHLRSKLSGRKTR